MTKEVTDTAGGSGIGDSATKDTAMTDKAKGVAKEAVLAGAGGAAAGTAAVAGTTGALSLAGFTSVGPAAGSLAATIQSTVRYF